MGARDRDTGRVVAKPIAFTDKEDLQGFVASVTEDGSVVLHRRGGGIPRNEAPVPLDGQA